MKLNSQLFNWPARMDPIFEVSQKRLASRREKAEKDVKDRREEFEQTLKDYEDQIEGLREKEVKPHPLLSTLSAVVIACICI